MSVFCRNLFPGTTPPLESNQAILGVIVCDVLKLNLGPLIKFASPSQGNYLHQRGPRLRSASKISLTFISFGMILVVF